MLFDDMQGDTINVLQNIKANIEGHAVDWYSDVFDLVFPNLNTKEMNNVWKHQLKEDKRKKRDRDHDDDDDDDDD